MISFNPTEEEVEFTNIANKVAQQIRDKAREIERDVSKAEEITNEINEIGFNKMEEPERLGGMEFPILSQVQVYSALAYGDLGTVQGFPGLGDGASFFRVLEKYDRVNRIEESITGNGNTFSFIDNTDALHDGFSLTKNKAAYVLHGETNPIRLANIASHLIIATADQDGEMVLLYVDRQYNPWTRIQGSYYLGLQEAHIARLSFEQQSVPNVQVIANGREAEQLIQEAKTRIYLLQAAKQLGTMQAAVDYATEHTATRKAFGETIAKFQGVSFRVSQMIIETNVTRNLIWQAASAIDNNDEEAESLVLSAFNRAHKAVKYVTDSAVQLLGGHGFVQDYPVEKWMRDAQAQALLYGNENDFLFQRGKRLISSLKTEVEV